MAVTLNGVTIIPSQGISSGTSTFQIAPPVSVGNCLVILVQFDDVVGPEVTAVVDHVNNPGKYVCGPVAVNSDGQRGAQIIYMSTPGASGVAVIDLTIHNPVLNTHANIFVFDLTLPATVFDARVAIASDQGPSNNPTTPSLSLAEAGFVIGLLASTNGQASSVDANFTALGGANDVAYAFTTDARPFAPIWTVGGGPAYYASTIIALAPLPTDPQLSDSFGQTDKFQFVKTAAGAGTQAQIFTGDALTQTDKLVLGIGLQLSDQMELSDRLQFVKTNTGAGTQAQILTGDRLRMQDDNFVTVTGIWQLKIICPEWGTIWQDSVAIGYGMSLKETLSLSESVVIGIGSGITETLTITDSLRLGYGLLIGDSLTLSDTVTLVLGLGVALSESLTISDSMGLGYGLLIADTMTLTDSVKLLLTIPLSITETLTISDSMGLGYGLSITESLDVEAPFQQNAFQQNAFQSGSGLRDQIVLVLGVVSGEIDETFSDSISFSDQLRIGYGNIVSDVVVFADSLTLGYGLLIADSMSLTDSIQLLLGMIELLSDSMTMTDSCAIGYGNQITDSLTLTDSVVVVLGINEALADSMTLTDSCAVGYGNALTDSLTLTDSVKIVLGLNETVSEQLSISDSLALGYGLLIADTLVLSDSVALLLTTNASFAETLTITDSLSLGYGLLIADTMTLSDSAVVVLGLTEKLSDQLVLSDSIAIGYGNVVTDVIVLSDSMSLGYGLLISDQLVLTDSIALMLGMQMALSDSMTLTDSCAIGYGNQVSDQLTLTDSVTVVLGIVESFSDQLVMTDAVKLVFSFNPNFSESLNISDSAGLGYGLLISDQMTMSDAFTFSTGNNFFLNLSDQLVLTDAIAIGYGLLITDALALSDTCAIGYGNLLSDQLTLTDSATVVLGLNITLQDLLLLQTDNDTLQRANENPIDSTKWATITGWTAVQIVSNQATGTTTGTNAAVRKTAPNSDDQFSEVTIGTGVTGNTSLEPVCNSLTAAQTLYMFQGIFNSGPGAGTLRLFRFNAGSATPLTAALTTTLNVGDRIAVATKGPMVYGLRNGVVVASANDSGSRLTGGSVGIVLNATNTFISNWTGGVTTPIEQVLIGYGNLITDSLTLSDSMLIGVGMGMVDQLQMVDQTGIGYGLLISDSMNFWQDSIQINSGQPAISLNLSDTLTMQDSLGAGYGCQITDQTTMQDAIKLIEELQLKIAEASPNWLDAIQQLMTYGMQCSDSMQFQDQLLLMYGLKVSDQFTFSDRLDLQLLNVISLILSDSNAANWFDAFIEAFVFVPGAMVFETLTVLNAMTMSLKSILNQMDADGAGVDGELNATLIVEEYNPAGADSIDVDPEMSGDIEVID